VSELVRIDVQGKLVKRAVQEILARFDTSKNGPTVYSGVHPILHPRLVIFFDEGSHEIPNLERELSRFELRTIDGMPFLDPRNSEDIAGTTVDLHPLQILLAQ
jgi:hypothetical protein